MVDAVGVAGKAPAASYASSTFSEDSQAGSGHNASPTSTPWLPPDPKKLRLTISKTEKCITLFDLDLGPVPILDKDNLSRKETILLHEKAKTMGIYKGNPKAAAESMDDILSCATINFLGKGTKLFFNRNDNNDPCNNKMCTVLVKLKFKDKETRFRTELTLKKAYNVSCFTPYPKKPLNIMDTVIKECKVSRPKSFIRARVDTDKLCATAWARTDSGLEDLSMN
jgi:hypothetical protein